jgi:cation:H+ antiporter
LTAVAERTDQGDVTAAMNDLFTLIGGGVLLYFGAEWLVGGAASLAISLRIPQLIVGLTIVAYGTSAPELVVGVDAALGGHGEVALGNVIGSNIANFGLILGIAVLIRPARVEGVLARRELPVLALATLALPLVLLDGTVRPWEAALLLAGALAYTVAMMWSARFEALAEARRDAVITAESADLAGAPDQGPSRKRQAAIAFGGLIVLLIGGHLFVGAATSLALAWGISERVVGLTIVAVGTSLPELVASAIAAVRGHSDIAVGNVIGSNIFNVLLCLGAAGLAGSVGADPATLLVDFAVLLAITLIGAACIRGARVIRRWEGAVLLGVYFGFMGYLTLAGG